MQWSSQSPSPESTKDSLSGPEPRLQWGFGRDIHDATVGYGQSEHAVITGVVDLRENLGAEVHLTFVLEGIERRAEGRRAEEEPSAPAYARGDANPAGLFVARVDPQSACREGDVLQAALDLRKLYFFDPNTGGPIATASDSQGHLSDAVAAP